MYQYLNWKKKAMLMAANTFWLPSGLSIENCIAAYQFKGASSETVARRDLTGNGYTMYVYTETDDAQSTGDHAPTWSASSGFTFDAVYRGRSGFLNNNDLNQQNIKAAVVRYSGLTQNNRGYLLTAGGSAGTAFLYAATTVVYYTAYSEGSYTAQVQNYGGPGFVTSAYSSPTWVGTVGYTTTSKNSGVVGANFATNKALYIDGVKTTTTSSPSGKTFTDVNTGENQGRTFGNSRRSYSDLGNATFAGKSIIAAAFFGVELTDAQHKEVADMMAQM